MFWLYLALATLSVQPAIWVGVDGVRNGWGIWGASQIVTPIGWAIAAAGAIGLSRHVAPGAWKVFTHTLLVALLFMGAVFGQLLGLFSGLVFNYGASEAGLAIGFVLFFGLGAVIALAPSALIGAIAVLFANALSQSRATSHSQEH